VGGDGVVPEKSNASEKIGAEPQHVEIEPYQQKRYHVREDQLKVRNQRDEELTARGENHHLSKFTPERTTIVIEALERNNYRKVAASLAGINNQTLINWIKRGRLEESGPFHEFYENLLKAEAKAESDLLRYVVDAAPDDWKASMELLRRRHPDRWNRERKEVTGKEGGPIKIQVVYAGTEEIIDGEFEELDA